MSRMRNFDSEAVVRAAREVFWERGFEAASIPELEAATGLARSSLYNAFRSKRGLFDAAVQSYLDEVVRTRLAPLMAEDVAPGAILDYLDGLRAAFVHADSTSASNGCLLVNCAGSPISHDTEVARVIADYRSELETAIGRGIAARLGSDHGAQRVRLDDAVTGLVVAAFALVRVVPDEAVRCLDSARGLIEQVEVPAAR